MYNKHINISLYVYVFFIAVKVVNICRVRAVMIFRKIPAWTRLLYQEGDTMESNMMCCEECEVHEDVVEKVKSSVPEDDKLYQLADLYKKFADFTRVKIMYMLLVSEMCVCDLSRLLEMSQPAVSNHLRVLKQANLVKSRKQGKQVFYSLADSHVETLLNQGMEHVNE